MSSSKDSTSAGKKPVDPLSSKFKSGTVVDPKDALLKTFDTIPPMDNPHELESDESSISSPANIHTVAQLQ